MQLCVETHAVLLIPIRPICMQMAHFAAIAFKVKNCTQPPLIRVEQEIVHTSSLVPLLTLILPLGTLRLTEKLKFKDSHFYGGLIQCTYRLYACMCQITLDGSFCRCVSLTPKLIESQPRPALRPALYNAKAS